MPQPPLSSFSRQRRAFTLSAASSTAAAALGLPHPALAQATEHARDWAWLVGNWDVRHSRLRRRLAGDTHWDTFAGKSALWLTLGGLGTIDDNLLELPDGSYRALGIRAFNPQSGKWAIWWLDGRDPTHVGEPVLGAFEGDGGEFSTRDTFNGKPIIVRFRWKDIHSALPNWEQAFSPDDGINWEVNWRNYFTRTSATPQPLPRLPGANHDWDFLVGSWKASHRRLRQRLVGSQDWETFGGTLVNWPVLGGAGNVGDSLMALPGGTVRGVGLRAFDPATSEWRSWWLDGREPAAMGTPLRGRFAGGVGTFLADDTLDGRPIKTCVRWSGISATTARWEQSCSADGGATWEVNWVTDFTRKA